MLASMKLSELAAGVPGAVVEVGAEIEVQRVLQDSREAGPGDLQLDQFDVSSGLIRCASRTAKITYDGVSRNRVQRAPHVWSTQSDAGARFTPLNTSTC